jgi:hypothetical protein
MVRTKAQREADERYFAAWDSKLSPLEISPRARKLCYMLFAFGILETVVTYIFNIGELLSSYPESYREIASVGLLVVNVLLCGYVVSIIMNDWSEEVEA